MFIFYLNSTEHHRVCTTNYVYQELLLIVSRYK